MTLDMTLGKPLRLMVRFALPLMLTSILQQLYTMTDGVIVGQMLGAEAFAAVGVASGLHLFPLSMLLGLTQGFGVLLSQRFGAKDEAGFRRALAMSLGLGLIAGLLQTGVGLGCLLPFLRLAQTPGPLIGAAAGYLRILWLGLPLSALYNVCATMLLAIGDSRTPFLALVLSTVLNIALDYLLIAAFSMGVAGAALATVAAQALALAFCLLRVRWREDARPDGATIRHLLRLGIPPMLSQTVMSVGSVTVQAVVNVQGVAFVTGMTAARRYFPLLNIVGNALEGALAMFVGQNFGAKKPRRVMEGTNTAVGLCLVTFVIIALPVILLSGPLIRLFIPQGSEEMISVGIAALRVETLFMPFMFLLCLYRAAIQGMGNASVPMLSGFMELALRLLCVWLLPSLWGREGLYFADGITWIATAAMLIIAYYSLRGRLLFPGGPSESPTLSDGEKRTENAP